MLSEILESATRRGIIWMIPVVLVACCVLSCGAAFLLRGDLTAAQTLVLGDENTVQVGADNEASDTGGGGQLAGGQVVAGRTVYAPPVQVLTIPLTPGNTLMVAGFCICAFVGALVFMIVFVVVFGDM